MRLDTVNADADSEKLPAIKFTSWFKWEDRRKIQDSDKPGVYALAKFKRKPPAGRANPLDKNIIYFGETCRQSLKARWEQFDRSAFQGKAGHAGGKNYREQYGLGDKGSDLYVAAFSPSLKEPLRSLYIRFVERKLILNYFQKWNNMPKCNKK